jgi:hypothetical protein
VSVVGTDDYFKRIIFSLALGISHFVNIIHLRLWITLDKFLILNILSNVSLSEGELFYVRNNRCRNINLPSIVLLD